MAHLAHTGRYLSVNLVQPIDDAQLRRMLRTLTPLVTPPGGDIAEDGLFVVETGGLDLRQVDYTARPKLGRRVRVAWGNGAVATCPSFHTMGSRFCPSLAEVYGSVLAFVADWHRAKFLWLEEAVVDGRPLFWNNWTPVFMARVHLFDREFDAEGFPL